MRIFKKSKEHPTAIVTLRDRVPSFPDNPAILGGSVVCCTEGAEVFGGHVGRHHVVGVVGRVVVVVDWVVVVLGVVLLGVVGTGANVGAGK